MKKILKWAFFWTKNIYSCIEQIYGFSKNHKGTEWLLANILFFYSIIEFLPTNSRTNEKTFENEFHKHMVLENAKQNIEYVFFDFKIYWNEKRVQFNNTSLFIHYKTQAINTIIDNLSNISKEIADPISEILQPMKNENELIGLISKIYKEFENVKKENLLNLKNIDKSIYDKTWSLAKMLVNNVEGAKGHKGNSELTIKDIAHNFALNASLIQKLINLNQQKETKNH